MIMTATVIRVENRGLLVRNAENGQEVFVNYANPRAFRAGDTIQITYPGMMTFSIPPQISATSIARAAQPQTQPSSSSVIRRARILRVDRGVFYARDLSNQRQIVVVYPYAYHFCVGQLVTVRYETVFLDVNEFRVIATDVSPIC